MVFGWLFGEKKRQEETGPDIEALLVQADEATNARDTERAEGLCREVIRFAPDHPDAWSMLGVNLIRRAGSEAALRAEAVIAWMRALALRPGDSRAADHLQTELQYPDDLIPALINRLGDAPPSSEDAAGVLAQIGHRAKAALEQAAQGTGSAMERARAILVNLP